MSTPVVESERRGFRAPGTTFMVSGGLIGAIGAYIFQVYGGRAIGAEAFAPIGVLWTVFFILATVLLVPVEQYVTREVAAGRKAIPHDLWPAMITAGIGATVGGAFVWATLDRFFGGSWQYIAQIVLLMFGYSLLMVGKGVLAGRRRFAGVGWILVLETTARLLAGIVAVRLASNAESLGWAMVLGGFAVVGMRWWRHDTGESRARAASAAGFLGGYVGGFVSSQLLLGGAPIAVALLGADAALVSVVFVTFTLYPGANDPDLCFAGAHSSLPCRAGVQRRSPATGHYRQACGYRRACSRCSWGSRRLGDRARGCDTPLRG